MALSATALNYKVPTPWSAGAYIFTFTGGVFKLNVGYQSSNATFKHLNRGYVTCLLRKLHIKYIFVLSIIFE